MSENDLSIGEKTVKEDPATDPSITDPSPRIKLTPLEPKRKKLNKKTKVILIFTLLTLIILSLSSVFGFFLYKYLGLQNSPVPTAPPIDTNVVMADPTPIATPAPVAREKVDLKLGEVSWITAKNIPAADIFRSLEEVNVDYWPFEPDSAEFKHIASYPGGEKLIDVLVELNGMGGGKDVLRFIQTDDGYVYIRPLDNKDEWWWEEMNKILKPGVNYTHLSIPGLQSPEKITADGKQFVLSHSSYKHFSEISGAGKLLDTSYGPMYLTNKSLFDISLYARKLYLRLKDDTLITYGLKPSMIGDDYVPKVNWSDGRSSTTRYTQSIVSGCGDFDLFGTVPVLYEDYPYLSAKQMVGTAQNGSEVFQFKDPANPVVKAIYNSVYLVGRESQGSLTLEKFAQEPNHFFWKDELGHWQFLVNSDYGAMAECAKPVIYLYPTQTTTVNVQVDAKISLSDPVYPNDGWTVQADSDGRLIFNGKQYDSLFWDGTGKGYYPDYGDRGVVVAADKLESTLKQHLSLLGLNSKESEDFMNFWLSKMPKTAYVRLTWLGTMDMEKLAYLRVTPTPDTKIRIFLEFEGLNTPKKLTPQKLTSVERRGFTVVEWGGLLITPK